MMPKIRPLRGPAEPDRLRVRQETSKPIATGT
jgi:hypothetical protein